MLARMWRNWSPVHYCWGSKMLQRLWKTALQFLKKANVELTSGLAVPFLGKQPKEPKAELQRVFVSPGSLSSICTIAKRQKQLNCPLTDELVNKRCLTHTM